MAAKEAAEIIKQRLIDFACQHFGVTDEDIGFANSEVLVGSQAFSFAEFVELAYKERISLSTTGYYRTPEFYDRKQGKGHPFFYFANGAAVSEVLIDTLTGEYKVLRVDICHDVGQSINPALDIGQIEGGFVQGMGWLTTEELSWGDDGRLQTTNLAGYKIPAIADLPLCLMSSYFQTVPILRRQFSIPRL